MASSSLQNASLYFVPSGYNTNLLYPIKPLGTANLDFSRASTATRVNASGSIESVASGVPRLDYFGGGCPSLLLEPQRTNIATYNETDAGSWGAATPVASGTIMGVNAYSIPTDLNSGDSPFNDMAVEFIADTTYTASVLVDFSSLTANLRLAFLCASDQGAQFQGIFVDRITKIATSTGSGALSSLIASSVTQVTGEIYKVTISVNFAAGLTNVSISRCYCHSVNDLTSVRIAALQVEDGNYSTSYISKTTASAVTRLAEAATKSSISSLIGSTSGSFFIDAIINTDSSNADFFSLSNTSDAALGAYILYLSGANGNIELYTLPSNTSIVLKSGNNRNTRLKIAFAYTSGNVTCYINGTQVYTSTSFTLAASLARLDINSNYVPSGYGQSLINTAAIYPVRLSNAELQALTTL